MPLLMFLVFCSRQRVLLFLVAITLVLVVSFPSIFLLISISNLPAASSVDGTNVLSSTFPEAARRRGRFCSATKTHTTLILDFRLRVTIDIPVNDAKKGEEETFFENPNIVVGSPPFSARVEQRPSSPRAENKLWPEFNQFLFAGPMFGGLGNQLYKFASLHALGMALNRTLVYLPGEKVMRKMEREIADTFPNFYRRIYYANPQQCAPHSVDVHELVPSCCSFHDPQKLHEYRRTFLELRNDVNFEMFHFFHPIRERIRDVFRCSADVMQRVKRAREQMFRLDGDTNTFKLCVHTRRGDFVAEEGKIASDRALTEAATRHVLARLDNTAAADGVSVVLLGEDKDFLRSLFSIGDALENSKKLRGVHMTEEMLRGDEMCFGVHTCDALLITAHFSSYAFWIGYLMPATSPVFYIANFVGSHDYLNFPPEWRPIEASYLAWAIQTQKTMALIDEYQTRLARAFAPIQKRNETEISELL